MSNNCYITVKKLYYNIQGRSHKIVCIFKPAAKQVSAILHAIGLMHCRKSFPEQSITHNMLTLICVSWTDCSYHAIQSPWTTELCSMFCNMRTISGRSLGSDNNVTTVRRCIGLRRRWTWLLCRNVLAVVVSNTDRHIRIGGDTSNVGFIHITVHPQWTRTGSIHCTDVWVTCADHSAQFRPQGLWKVIHIKTMVYIKSFGWYHNTQPMTMYNNLFKVLTIYSPNGLVVHECRAATNGILSTLIIMRCGLCTDQYTLHQICMYTHEN